MASPEFFPLPLELLCEIFTHLPATDLQTLSLVSRRTRSQAIRILFGHLRLGYESYKVRNIHQARKDVKDVIKKLEVAIGVHAVDADILYQFLETLPNLEGLYLLPMISPASLPQFISSIRHTALLELVLETCIRVKGPPTAGLAGLEKLSIRWHTGDSLNEPGSSQAHLYEFIRPTLTTLVNLKLGIDMHYDFDLRLLKPAGDTLRIFDYTLQSADETILDTIPAILPHLTKLSVKWAHSVLWKDAHIQALSKNKNITDLALSSNFEVNPQDTDSDGDDYAWCMRCYERRLNATQDIASACPRLQRCCWFQLIWSHPFIVEERMRVVRGIKPPREHSKAMRNYYLSR